MKENKPVRKVRKRRRRQRRISRKTELRLKLGAFGVCMAAGIAGIFFYFAGADLKLSDLLKISLVGYDSEGWIKAELDGTEAVKEIPEVQQILDTVKMDFSQQEHLSNGDVVEVTYTYDKELARKLDIRLEDDPAVFTVENLPQAESISLKELFEDVELTFEGTAPLLKVSVKNNSDHPYIKTMDFVIRDEKEYYKKNDTIVVDAVFDEEDAIAYRYSIERGQNGYSKSYTLDGIDSYLTSADQLGEEAKETLIAEGIKCFTDANEYGLRIFSEAGCMPIWVNKKTTFTWENPYVISMYFNTAKEEALGETGILANDVKVVYGVTLMQADGVHCDAEIVVRFDGLIQRADGTLDLALSSGSMISASHKDKFIKDIVHNTYVDEKYDSERIL